MMHGRKNKKKFLSIFHYNIDYTI